jgi:F0F1-type ATP synthase assembly protein I
MNPGRVKAVTAPTHTFEGPAGIRPIYKLKNQFLRQESRMKRRTDRFLDDSQSGCKIFLQEMAIAILLGAGLGFIFDDIFIGLILGVVYGLASYFVLK